MHAEVDISAVIIISCRTLCGNKQPILTQRQAFQQHCEYVRTPRGIVLQPMASLGVGKWLVIFCDEINLPAQVGIKPVSVLGFPVQIFWTGTFTTETI